MPIPNDIKEHDNGPRRKSRVNDALRERQEKTAREYNLLKELSHPNIISMEKVIRTTHNIYIFQELVTGGDLLSYLDKKGALDEAQAAMVARQLLEAVKYLHDNHIVHRDIKPENILMTSWKDGCRVVLTDFGHSRTIKDVENAAAKAGVYRMQSMVGTNGYTAPEVYQQMKKDLQDGTGYSQAIDIWSIGCVTAILLTNEHVFPDETNMRAQHLSIDQLKVHIAKIDSDAKWDSIGHRAKSFIKGCLATNENRRLTAQQCLALPWFQHPHYKAEFDAAYKHAIAGWTPRELDDEAIEFMDTKDIKVDRQQAHEEDEDTRSRHFQSSYTHGPHKDLTSLIARFRPNALHASPARRPDSVVEDYGNVEDSIFDDLEQNLSLASQNAAANIAALKVHARQPQPQPKTRKRVFR